MTNFDVESILDKLVSADTENIINWSIGIDNRVYANRNGVIVTLQSMGFYVGNIYYHYTGNEIKYNNLMRSAYNKATINSLDKFLE